MFHTTPDMACCVALWLTQFCSCHLYIPLVFQTNYLVCLCGLLQCVPTLRLQRIRLVTLMTNQGPNFNSNSSTLLNTYFEVRLHILCQSTTFFLYWFPFQDFCCMLTFLKGTFFLQGTWGIVRKKLNHNNNFISFIFFENLAFWFISFFSIVTFT
jgi:hypothetical protein